MLAFVEIITLRSVPLRLIKMFQQSSNQRNKLQTLDWNYLSWNPQLQLWLQATPVMELLKHFEVKPFILIVLGNQLDNELYGLLRPLSLI